MFMKKRFEVIGIVLLLLLMPFIVASEPDYRFQIIENPFLDHEFIFSLSEETAFLKNVTNFANSVDIKKRLVYNTMTNMSEYEYDFDFTNEVVLYNVYVYHEIPECIAKELDESNVITSRKFRVLQDKNVIEWHFEKIIDGEHFEFNLMGRHDIDCIDDGAIFGISESIFFLKKDINYFKLFFTILIVIMMVAIFLAFSSYTSSGIIKEEFLSNLIQRAKIYYKSGGTMEGFNDILIKEGVDKNTRINAITMNSKNFLHFWILKFELGIIEICVLFLIALNFLDSFELLSSDMSFVKNLLSWSILSFMLYNVSLSKIFFGVQKRWVDITLVITFFVMILKKLVNFAIESALTSEFFIDLFVWIIRYNYLVEKYFFIIGLMVIFVLSLVLTFTVHYNKTSVIRIFPVNNKLVKFMLTFLILICYFEAIYNLIFEWLAIIIDSQLGVILVFVYLVLWIKWHKGAHFSTALLKIGASVEKFYQKTMELLRYPRTLPIAISGILILNLVSQFGVYVLPYITGYASKIYMGTKLEMVPLFNLFHFNSETYSLFFQQTIGLGIFETILVFIIYMFNILFMLYFFGFPMYIWYRMFVNRKIPLSLLNPLRVKRYHIFLFSMSLIIFVMNPVLQFQMSEMNSKHTIDYNLFQFGIDIVTKKGIVDFNYMFSTFLIAIASSALLYAFCFRIRLKIVINNLILAMSALSIGIYLFFFFLETIQSYTSIIMEIDLVHFSFFNILWFISLVILLVINVLFYLGGLVLFYLELWNRREFPFEEYFTRKQISLTAENEMYFLHHYNLHDEFNDGDALDYLVSYIVNSANKGNSKVRIFKYLEAHEWPNDMIKDAHWQVLKLYPEVFNKKEIIVHTEEELELLKKWIFYKLNENSTLELIIQEALELGWTEDDLDHVFSQIKFLSERKYFDYAMDDYTIDGKKKDSKKKILLRKKVSHNVPEISRGQIKLKKKSKKKSTSSKKRSKKISKKKSKQ